MFFGWPAYKVQILCFVHSHGFVDIALGVNIGPQGSLYGQAKHLVLVGDVCVAFLTTQC